MLVKPGNRIIDDNGNLVPAVHKPKEAPDKIIAKLEEKLEAMELERDNFLSSCELNLGKHFPNMNEVGNYACLLLEKVKQLDPEYGKPEPMQPPVDESQGNDLDIPDVSIEEIDIDSFTKKADVQKIIDEKKLDLDISKERSVKKCKEMLKSALEGLEPEEDLL